MSLIKPGVETCASCHDKRATMIVTWRQSLPSGVVHRRQQLLICANCEPAARSFCMSSKVSVPGGSSPSGQVLLKHSWTVEVFRSPASEAAILKSKTYPELLGLVTIPKPSLAAQPIYASESSTTSFSYGTWTIA